MSASTTSRRTFLKAAGAATGGLLVGIALPLRGRAASGSAPASPAVNAYVRIGTDGRVRFIVPKSEMGQGTYTGLAQILADELEVDWQSVSVEAAPVAPVYNSSFAPMQFTGGSSSISGSFELLRKVGATARGLLIAAAAEELRVPASELAAAHGAVVHRASGRRLLYGALAARAAQLPVPADATPKPAAEWRLIGRSMPRLDTAAKVNGSAGFGLDVRLPQLHYAVIARAPSFGGRVASFDAAAARAVPGVVAVKEVPSGVAVIATNTWAAMRGRSALKVDWRDGPGAAVSSEAIAADYARRARTPGVLAHATGDAAAAAAAGARQRLEADFATPYLAHAPMEPLNCAVAFSAAGCDVYSGTQFQTVDRNAAAEVAGLPPEQVRVHTTFLGGGFGRRANPASDFVREAVAVAKDFGRPVLTVWTREDDIHGGYYRPQAHNRLTAALGADGFPLAWTHTQVIQSIIKGTPFEKMMSDPKTGIDAIQHEGASELPYAVPSLRVEVHDAVQPVPVLWWRSVGHTNTAFAVESFIDECAHAAGADPVAYRTALLAAQPRHLAVLKLAAEKAGWGTPPAPGRARGVAVHASFGSVVAEVAEVSLVDGRPKVHRVVAAIDCGLAVNPGQVAAQVESAICYGLSAALYGEVTLAAGRVAQSNFDDYPVVRLGEMPAVEVHIVASSAAPTGVGEPGTPPIAPAVANALYALSGVRARRLPLAHATFAAAKPA
jgi:isoquinoline 1-oxidoreductase beta subunit